MASTQAWHLVEPEGPSKANIVLSILFSVTTISILSLRVYIRTKHHLNGLEDYLMYVGGFLNIGHNAAVIYASYTGLGIKDEKLNMAIMIEAAKMVTVWQLLYVTSSPFIKASICCTLIRVAAQKRYKYILTGVCVFAYAMTIMAFIVVFIQCKPFAASWTGQGKCISVNVIIVPTYIFSVANVVIDWIVAILPIFILWDLQLRRKLKILSGMILGVGVLASIATLIRMAYIKDYAATSNKLYKVANIVLWTVVEMGLGVFAGSLPSLRKFFKGLANNKSSSDNSRPADFISLGPVDKSKNKSSINRMQNPIYASEFVTSAAADHSMAQDRDDDSNKSTRRIIQVTREIRQV